MRQLTIVQFEFCLVRTVWLLSSVREQQQTSFTPLLLLIDGTDRQTDGGTKPERYTDSASHIMPVASTQTYGVPLYLVNGLSKSTQLILLESLTTLESGCKINIITDAGIDPTIEDSGSFSLQVVLQFKYGSVRTVRQFGSFRVRFNSHHYCCCCCCFCK